jgi:hypothetical protein
MPVPEYCDTNRPFGEETFMRIMVVKLPRFFGNLIRKVLRMN